MNHQAMIDLSSGDDIYSLDVEYLDVPYLCYGEIGRSISKQDRGRRSPYRNEFWVLMPSILSGSDYSGSMVERSNYVAFLEQFSEIDGVIDVTGGYGTYAIALTLKALRNEEIREYLAALSDYSLMDEDKHSEMEYEAYQESWEQWGSADFKKALITHLEISEWLDDEDESDNPLYVAVDDLSDVELQTYYESLVPSGEYYICESGYSSAYIPVDRAAKDATLESLQEFLSDLEGVKQLSFDLDLV